MEHGRLLTKMQRLLEEIAGDKNCISQVLHQTHAQLQMQINAIFDTYYEKLRDRQRQAEEQINVIVRECQIKLKPYEQKMFTKRQQAEQIRKKLHRADPHRRQSQFINLSETINTFNDSLVTLHQDVQAAAERLLEEYRSRIALNKYWEVLQTNMKRYASSEALRSNNLKILNSPSPTKKHKPISPSKFQRLLTEYNMGQLPVESQNSSNLETLNNYKPEESRESRECEFTLNPSVRGRSYSSEPRSRQKSSERKKQNMDLIEGVLDMVRCNPTNQTILSLINCNIKDFYIPALVECIRSLPNKFGVIKLSHNHITDDGFTTLLRTLKNYPYVHTLNLTSNQLTEDSLKIIVENRRNRSLCNFYLGGNKLTNARCRGKRQMLGQAGINIFF